MDTGCNKLPGESMYFFITYDEGDAWSHIIISYKKTQFVQVMKFYRLKDHESENILKKIHEVLFCFHPEVRGHTF